MRGFGFGFGFELRQAGALPRDGSPTLVMEFGPPYSSNFSTLNMQFGATEAYTLYEADTGFGGSPLTNLQIWT